MGSPALGAYSLLLTSLNARLVYRRARRIKHDSKNDVAKTLISLQQTTLELTKDERLLALIPVNDQWRREIADRLTRRNAWSVATGSSVAWVVIAFIFTLVDSFVSLTDPAGQATEGLAVGTLWLWLLCLVIGWLWVPTFTSGELTSAISHANRQAAKKAAKRIKQRATKAYSSAKLNITNIIPRRMQILKGSKKPAIDSVPEGDEENEGAEIQEDTQLVGQRSEPTPNPLPIHSHHQSIISFQTPVDNQHGHFIVSVNPTANQSTRSLSQSAAVHSVTRSSIHPETDRLLIPREGMGSLNRDELRLAATFNYSRTMRYLVLVDDVLRALDRVTRERDEVCFSGNRPILEFSHRSLTEEEIL